MGKKRKAALAAATDVIAYAQLDLKPFEVAPEKASYSCGELTLRIEHYTTDTLPSHMVGWAAELVGRNCGDMYRKVWGWDLDRKTKELQHANSRFLVAYTCSDDKPIAFCNFQWEVDPPADERTGQYWPLPIAYIYEIQLEPSVQGKGLGSYLMDLLEQWAHRYGVRKLMLTCFQSNTAALAMYRKLGYELDESSPDPELDGPELAGYDILSKYLD